MIPSPHRHPSSYRDPAGFVFEHEGVLYRQVNYSYRSHYDRFMTSGLYDRFRQEKLIVEHDEVEFPSHSEAYKILKPEKIPFISYPYEWCHTQLQAAAKLTLRILRISQEYGMILKDASPYNIQFIGPKPIFIDTLSWEIHSDRSPWIAYRQFCECFLAPMALSCYRQIPIHKLYRAWPDGLPLEIATRLLPTRTKWNMHLLLHLHLQSRIKKMATYNKKKESKQYSVDLSRIIDSLQKATEKLSTPTRNSNWTDYYQAVQERGEYFSAKERIVQAWIREIRPTTTCLDAGCNLGHFTKELATFTRVIAFDSDAGLIDLNHQRTAQADKEHDPNHILFLVQDICDMSSDQGVDLKERAAFFKRTKYEIVLCLALMHHLVIGRQIPLESVIGIFMELASNWLIIEFIPADDPWSKTIQSGTNEQSQSYTQHDFEAQINNFFTIQEKCTLAPTGRWLYKLKKNN